MEKTDIDLSDRETAIKSIEMVAIAMTSDPTEEQIKAFNDYLQEPAICTPIVEFTKYDQNKPRYGLIPPIAEAEMVQVLTFGAQKYSVDNWRNCDDMSRYVDAALRHISAYRRGEFKDSETGLHHLAHAMCCLSFIVDIELGDIEIKVVER